jgi:hypothetical protein
MVQPMEAPSAVCNFCGKHLGMGQILYTTDARVACVECNAKVEMVGADMKVGHNIRNASVYSLVAAGISLLAYFLMLPRGPKLAVGTVSFLIISSVIAALFALTSVNRKGDERFTQHIQKDKGTIYACSIIGLVLDGLMIILVLLAIVAIMSRPTIPAY